MGWSRFAQLLAAGLDRDAIAYRRRVGRLHLLHRGVYAVGHRPPSPLATAMAAVLACGPDAALSHRSAAALWRILPRWHSPIGSDDADQAPPPRHPRPPLPPADATTHYGIPVTTPARTFVDLADVLTPTNSPEPSTRPRSNGSSRAHRADHPPHPISRTAHLTAHARAGRHPLPPRGQLHPLPQTPPPPAPRAKPTDRRPRSRRRLPSPQPRHRTRQPPVPHHHPTPSKKTATATPTSSTRGSPRSASPTTASSTTHQRGPTGSQRILSRG